MKRLINKQGGNVLLLSTIIILIVSILFTVLYVIISHQYKINEKEVLYLNSKINLEKNLNNYISKMVFEEKYEIVSSDIILKQEYHEDSIFKISLENNQFTLITFINIENKEVINQFYE